MPLGPNLQSLGFGPDVGGIFGVALVIVQPGGLESDALLASYRALPRGASPWVQWVDLAVRAG